MTVSFKEQRKNMLESQVRTNDVSDVALIDAISNIEREIYVADNAKAFAYAEVEVTGKSGRKMMKMRDLAKLMQAAKIDPKNQVLVIGGSNGYAAAIINDTGAFATIADSIENDGIKTDLLSLNEIEDNRYDVIFVDGGVDYIPDAWFSKLKEGGRLAAIVYDTSVGVAKVFVKSGENCASRNFFEAKPPKIGELVKAQEFSL